MTRKVAHIRGFTRNYTASGCIEGWNS